MLSVKQGGIKYHFLSLWYDSAWIEPRSPGLLVNTLPLETNKKLSSGFYCRMAESKIMDKFLNLASEPKIALGHEGDNDTNSSWRTRNGAQKFGIKEELDIIGRMETMQVSCVEICGNSQKRREETSYHLDSSQIFSIKFKVVICLFVCIHILPNPGCNKKSD